MSPQTGATATTTPAKAPRRRRGEGQWALGYHEPLNKNEENKKNDDGLNVRQRIIDIYSKQGFDSIDPADLRGRMRWYGLYTQRRPGIDGGKTAVLEPEELDDKYFMLRVRIDGGQLSVDQLRAISEISVKYARGTADVTDRQNVQLHWIEIESVPAIWETLEAVGLSTTEACGDTPRVIVGCPLAGLDADELIDATDEITAVADRYIGDEALSNLPRKFKSSISGCASQCSHHEINDVAFAAVRHPQTGEVGYDLWVGGGLSTNPMIAKRLGAFVRQGQVPEVLLLQHLAELLRPPVGDQELDPRAVPQPPVPVVAEELGDRVPHLGHLALLHERAQPLGDHRVGREPAADPEVIADLARLRVADGGERDVVDLVVRALGRAAADGRLVLARQVG